MPVPIGSLALNIARSKIQRELVERALNGILKKQARLKRSKKLDVGAYKVYKNKKNNPMYSVKDLYRDTKALYRILKVFKSRSIFNMYRMSKSIYSDLNRRVKLSENLKKLYEIQKNYKLNIFDKVIFDLSQKKSGTFTLDSLKDSSAELFKSMFSDEKTAENFTQAFHEYVDFRIDSLDRLGFLNKNHKEVFEVTDLFLNRLESLKLLDKDIPLDVDFNNYHLYILNDAIKNNGIDLIQAMEQFKNSPDIQDPENRLKIFQNVCDKLAKYNYLEKIIEDDNIKYKITDKGVSEIFMYRDLDKLEKSIYSHLKENNGVFNHELYINDLRKNIELLNSIQKLMPVESPKIKKPFEFGKYDANFLFREFEGDKLSIEKLADNLNKKFKEPEEASSNFEIMIKRLNKNVDNGYLNFDKETNTYSITDKGREAAESISNSFSFTSYDANVIFNYIKNNRGRITMEELNEILQAEYSNPKNAEKQFEYLKSRFEKNVKHGYLIKDEEGNYIISEKGIEEDNKILGDLIEKINNKLAYLRNANLIDENLMVKDLFHDVKDRRLSHFDKLMYDIAEINKGILTAEFLIENITIHYMNNKGATKETNDKIKDFEDNLNERLSTLSRVDFLKINSDGTYSLTEEYNTALLKQGEYKEKLYRPKDIDELTKFHYYLLSQATSKDGLSVELLLDSYKKEGLSDPEGKLKYVTKILDRLTHNDYLSFSSNNTFHITKKGVEAVYSNRYLSHFEKLLYETARTNNWVIDTNELINRIMKDKKLSAQVRKDFIPTEKKPFTFGKYDANVIFKEFDKDKTLKLDILKQSLKERHEDQEEASKQFDIISKRIEKLKMYGYIDFDEGSSEYHINDKGIKSAIEVNKTFNFTSYDINVVFKYIDDNGGILSTEELKNKLLNEYSDKEYANNQYVYLGKRFNNNVKAGYLGVDNNGNYFITEKGIEERDKDLSAFKEFLHGNLDSLESIHLINKVNDIYNVSNLFNDIVNKKVNHVDKILYDIAMDNDGVINFTDLKDSLRFYVDENRIEEYFELMLQRKDSLIDVGYIRSINNECYHITNSFKNTISEKYELQITGEKPSGAKELKITSYDQSILNSAIDEVIDLEERKDYFANRYKKRPNEAERQLNMLQGRCKKLCDAGYLEEHEKGFKIIKRPEKEPAKEKINTGNKVKKEVLDTFKITKFDHDNISNHTVNGIWDSATYLNDNSSIDKDILYKKLESVKKRLHTLSDMGLATELSENKWKIDDMLIERSKLKTNELTKEQVKVLHDIKDFLNFTETQISTFIYGDKDKISMSDLNNLVNRGILDCESRDIRNTGDFEKVYFVTSKGKKEICKLFDKKMKDLFDSKIHSRPEELRHDILIYSAFTDAKEALESKGFTVTDYMTDRQMRSYDMSHNNAQRKDYADLYIEYKDNVTGEIAFINLEIDVGYSPKVIKGKSENIENLFWYTDSENQMEKIKKYANTNFVKTLNF